MKKIIILFLILSILISFSCQKKEEPTIPDVQKTVEAVLTADANARLSQTLTPTFIPTKTCIIASEISAKHNSSFFVDYYSKNL